ncbi:Peptidase M1 and/or CopC domain containing protein, partial [Asbolus verrucosus]
FTNSSPIENRAEETPEYRLPVDVAFPDNYNLELTLEENVFDINKFSGILKLTFKILKETQEIKLHANDKLQFSEVKLTGKDGKEIANINYAVNSQTEILTITTDTILSTGDYILNFIYTGDLRTDGMYGFYKSYYLDSEGQYNYLATTQFQATYARRAFPCFDEPLFKATFDIKIRHQEKFNALGNTKGERRLDADKPGFVVTTFGQTPKMSTYLVAFIVSDFDCSLDDSSVPHQICSRVEAASTRKLALELGPQILTALEDYTGVPYADEQITKIDQVAIPDFSAGAMENWGLATYRETALLWDEQKSSNRYKQRIATVITHELAHMWFGDLVTTHWWDDTFLNEGWATYLEYFITAKVLNDWQLEKQFVLDELQPMLQIDSLQSSRPLSFKASTPAEVSSRFTSVSYNKGGSILRMVENFMGTENFKKGITKYLKDNSYNNVVPSDLWTAFQEFTADLPETLEKVMEKWVIKSGYPLLTVRVNGSNVIISQERFFTDGGVPSDSEKWYVPVTWTKSNDPNTFQNRWLLPSEDLVIQGELTDATEWIILNKQQI